MITLFLDRVMEESSTIGDHNVHDGAELLIIPPPKVKYAIWYNVEIPSNKI